jgi:shikimate kinase
MGVGKSTIGHRLARALGLEFHDADKELEEKTGATINLIFDVEGEAGFRAREKGIVDALTQLEGIVLATGGGVILDADNRRLLKQRGFVVYLRAPPEKLFARTRYDKSRPLLRGANPRQTLERIIAEREPLYREVADLIVDTDKLTVRGIIKVVRERLGR